MTRRVLYVAALMSVATLAGCGEPLTERNQRSWGCGEIAGAEVVVDKDAPRWVVVGESTESREGPAAVAELACHMASAGKPVWVGYANFGDLTDGEAAMLARLGALQVLGAPIEVAPFDAPLSKSGRKTRTRSERARADSIRTRVAATGAVQGLLFTSRDDAAISPFLSNGERFVGYDPMPMHLGEGGVLSLEIRKSDATGGAPGAVRIYPSLQDGFRGELGLASLTRPGLAVAMPGRRETIAPRASSADGRPVMGIFQTPPHIDAAPDPTAPPASAPDMQTWPVAFERGMSLEQHRAAYRALIASLPEAVARRLLSEERLGPGGWMSRPGDREIDALADDVWLLLQHPVWTDRPAPDPDPYRTNARAP